MVELKSGPTSGASVSHVWLIKDNYVKFGTNKFMIDAEGHQQDPEEGVWFLGIVEFDL